MDRVSTIRSLASKLSSRIVGRSPYPHPKGGGGGGRGGGSSGGRSGASTGKGAGSSGSVKPSRGGVTGGSGAGTGRAYPGTAYRGTLGSTGRPPSALDLLKLNLPGLAITSLVADDQRNLCPLLVSVGHQLEAGNCTIKGKPAMDVFTDMIKSKLEMGTAETAEQYVRAATNFAGGLRSIRDTDCDGNKWYEQGGEVKGQWTKGEALSQYAGYYENPDRFPGTEYSLQDWCNEVTPYDKETGLTEDQSHIVTGDADTYCKAMLIARAAPDKTFNGGSSQVFFDEIKHTMGATPYTNKVVELLGTQIDQLENSKLDGVQSDWIASMREKEGWLDGQDLAKEAQAQETFRWASRCEWDAAGKAAGRESLLAPWTGSIVATGVGLVAVL